MFGWTDPRLGDGWRRYQVKIPPEESLMSMVTLEEAQARLSELIHHLRADEEVVIIENSQPVARLIMIQPSRAPRKLGTLQGTVLNMAPDFDAPLEDFKEYMG